jgi:hypothetical protein
MLAGTVMVLLLASCDTSYLEAPERLGPPSVVLHENEPRLWLLVQQEEFKQRTIGLSRRTSGTIIREVFYHFDLQAHDTRTTGKLWKTRLLTLKDQEGGRSAQARILGQDGKVVWLFLHDQPVAIASSGGTRLADRALLEQRNPALRGLLAKELKFYAFDQGLVITTADSRRYKVRSTDFSSEPYQPASEEQFSRQQFMATQWNGGYSTGDFLTRQAMLNGRWFGLYTEKEAADAGEDSFGESLANPDSVLRESTGARRTFWTARIGQTEEFSEGSHDRLFDVTRVPEAPGFVDGGLFIKQGSRQPLALEAPGGLLVMHRTRLDEEGRAVLTRLDETLHEKWSAKMPFIDLRNRFEFPDRLLMYGLVQVTEKGVTGSQECIASLDLRDGRTQAWNVTLDRSIAATELEPVGRQ